MSTFKFMPADGMSTDLMAAYLKVREQPGWHAEYPYGGATIYGQVKNSYPPGAYNGLTNRVFLFKVDNQPTSLEAYSSDAKGKLYNRAVVGKDGKCHSVYIDNTTAKKEVTADISETIDPGECYSLAVRLTDTKYFQTYVNDTAGFKADMQSITLPSWQWILNAANDTVLSIHFSAEEAKNFPSAGLGQSYECIPKFSHPPGSTLFVEFVVTDPSKKITIALASDTSPTEYANTSALKANQKVTAFIRNSPDSWTVSASFDPVPRVIPHGTKDAQSNLVFLSKNCSIVRMNHSVITTG